jgi:trans-aconitate methyltransferase
MNDPFPQYLLAKQTVDDRALNQHVLAALRTELAQKPPVHIIEVGAGMGTMLARLLRWGILPPGTRYTLLDELPENIAYARSWLANQTEVHIEYIESDVFNYIDSASPAQYDLLIAHAFLDLLSPMPQALSRLLSLLKPGALAWLTINFDGVTTLEPPTQSPHLDALIERLYHASMDSRPTGGDSQSGRHLFGHLASAGAQVLAAGASDWVVYPSGGRYPAQEAYFLQWILHFFESSLSNHPELDPIQLKNWLAERRAQIERGELVYIAHQMDFLARV